MSELFRNAGILPGVLRLLTWDPPFLPDGLQNNLSGFALIGVKLEGSPTKRTWQECPVG
jgi:hypothetical protein